MCRYRMRPYGVPEMSGHSWNVPDMHEIALYGFKGAAGRLPGPGGDIRSCQSSAAKGAARRIWKKKTRQAVKRDLYRYMQGAEV